MSFVAATRYSDLLPCVFRPETALMHEMFICRFVYAWLLNCMNFIICIANRIDPRKVKVYLQGKICLNINSF